MNRELNSTLGSICTIPEPGAASCLSKNVFTTKTVVVKSLRVTMNNAAVVTGKGPSTIAHPAS
jgi:hypothetical protein